MSEEPKILSLSEGAARLGKRTLEHSRLAPYCSHLAVVIDGHARIVECSTCKAKLDPMEVLAQLAGEESRLADYIRKSKEERALLDAKARFQCSHCGKVTIIFPGHRNEKEKPKP